MPVTLNKELVTCHQALFHFYFLSGAQRGAGFSFSYTRGRMLIGLFRRSINKNQLCSAPGRFIENSSLFPSVVKPKLPANTKIPSVVYNSAQVKITSHHFLNINTHTFSDRSSLKMCWWRGIHISRMPFRKRFLLFFSLFILKLNPLNNLSTTTYEASV